MAWVLCILCWASCENMPSGKGNNNPNDMSKNFVKPGMPIPLDYPDTHRDTTVLDDYFGEKIPDPYRWLEDDNSAETANWVKQQNEATFGYLAKIPYREAFRQRLSELWNYEKFGSPFKEGEQYYYFHNSGLQNQSVLFGTEDPAQEGHPVLDPNGFSEDGTSSLANLGFSKDGKYLAYGVSEGGSDWNTIYVKDMETGETLADKVEWVKFSGISWHKDGFFYSRYPKPKTGDDLTAKNQFHAMYYHKVGTPQAKDELVFMDRRNPKNNVYGAATDDGKFLVVSTSETTSYNRLYFKTLGGADEEFTPIVEELEADYNLVGNVGDNLLVLTNDKAPNYRLISINTRKPERGYWEELIPESENVLQGVEMAGDKLVASYIKDAASELKVYRLDGQYDHSITLPTMGTVGSFNGKQGEATAFYSFTSFTYPTTIFQYDLEKQESKLFRSPGIKGITPSDYVTEQKFYESKDGTKIPLFVTYKKGTKMNGKNPTLLYGYGGFNISIQPSFSISRMLLLENGGIYAVANIRGGGEYGKAWHDGGRLENKQNVFDDFISAAEYLISENYTSADKLAIEGRSNGGLLVGACMTQRPDLFKVALPGVGVLDMLRYHEFTIGRAWATDYGLSTDSIQFQYLLNYSPLHNIQPKTEYPATLVTTADHDDRVVPAHSFKFISELQQNHEGQNPVLIRVDVSAGHGAGKPTEMVIREEADKMAFMMFNFGEDVRYGK